MITSTSQRLRELQHSMSSVIRGKAEAIHLAVVTLLAGGHLLLEGLPNKIIGDRIGASEAAVKGTLQQLFQKPAANPQSAGPLRPGTT